MTCIHFNGYYVLLTFFSFFDIAITSHRNPYSLGSSGLLLVSHPLDLHFKKSKVSIQTGSRSSDWNNTIKNKSYS